MLRQYARRQARGRANPKTDVVYGLATRREAYHVLDAGDRSDAVVNLRESEGIWCIRMIIDPFRDKVSAY